LSGKEGEEWKRLYEENTTDCFYCGCPCHKKAEPARDHVIPFDFVLSDELYNSVPSCIKCNSAKSNKLPDKKILKKVIERNESLENKIGYSKESFTKLYENCKEVYHGNRKEFVWQERDCS
jgi:CRISPR/Cas system Type II protein with McrA/HNH and RuvC-like nuclease domain